MLKITKIINMIEISPRILELLLFPGWAYAPESLHDQSLSSGRPLLHLLAAHTEIRRPVRFLLASALGD